MFYSYELLYIDLFKNNLHMCLMKNSFLFTLLTLISCSSTKEHTIINSSYTSTEIIKMAEWRFGYNLENLKLCNLYVVDGVPFNQENIDSVLAQIDQRSFRMVDFLTPSEENTWHHRDCDLIPLIQTTITKQKPKYTIEKLETIKEIYRKRAKEIKIAGTSCEYCPLVLIDYKYLNERDVLNELSKLRINDIDFIAHYNKSLNPEFYGSIGKNGVVEIFTYKYNR